MTKSGGLHMGKVSSESRFGPSGQRYGQLSVLARGPRSWPKQTHFGPTRHHLGAKWVQTRPKGNPNITQVDLGRQKGQRNPLGPVIEVPGPVLGDFGPFWTRLGPGHLGARRTAAAKTWDFRCPTLIVCGPNTTRYGYGTPAGSFTAPCTAGPTRGPAC